MIRVYKFASIWAVPGFIAILVAQFIEVPLLPVTLAWMFGWIAIILIGFTITERFKKRKILKKP